MFKLSLDACYDADPERPCCFQSAFAKALFAVDCVAVLGEAHVAGKALFAQAPHVYLGNVLKPIEGNYFWCFSYEK